MTSNVKNVEKMVLSFSRAIRQKRLARQKGEGTSIAFSGRAGPPKLEILLPTRDGRNDVAIPTW